MRIWSRNLLLRFSKFSIFFYTSPSNFNYWYNFGVLALYFLLSQIVTVLF